jgi:hypothetical protein
MPDEERHERESDQRGDDRARVTEAALVAGLGEAVEEEGDPWGEQRQPA